MKKQITLLVIFCVQLIGSQVLGQEDGLDSRSKEQEVETTSYIFDDRIEVGGAQLTAMFAIGGNPVSKLGEKEHGLYAAEAGACLIYGDYYWYSGSGPLGFLFGTSSSWQYIAPYVTVGARMMIEDGDSVKIKMRDFVSPVVLNAGAQFGFGDSDIFFLGLGGNAAICYDFNNVYGKFSAGIDMGGFAVHFGGYANFTKNGDYYNYLSGGFFELRLALWDTH